MAVTLRVDPASGDETYAQVQLGRFRLASAHQAIVVYRAWPRLDRDDSPEDELNSEATGEHFGFLYAIRGTH
jgi:hypothetical protein